MSLEEGGCLICGWLGELEERVGAAVVAGGGVGVGVVLPEALHSSSGTMSKLWTNCFRSVPHSESVTSVNALFRIRRIIDAIQCSAAVIALRSQSARKRTIVSLGRGNVVQTGLMMVI